MNIYSTTANDQIQHKLTKIMKSKKTKLNQIVLYGVSKKMRISYKNGKCSEDDVRKAYNHNKKEAENFNAFGLSLYDLQEEQKKTHNPQLRNKLNDYIQLHKSKIQSSRNQNKQNLQKFDYYFENALEIGLRKVVKKLEKTYKTTRDEQAHILQLLIAIEFANLVAKKRSDKKEFCYERKTRLLMQISHLLYANDWKCGLSYSTGKVASYLIYVYLPNGAQLSWHCNDYHIIDYFEEEQFTWDRLPCSSLEKLLAFAHDEFGIGGEFIRFDAVA